MAVVRLGPDGEVEVLVPPTPEEVAEAEAALLRVAAALGRVAAERDWQDQQRQWRGSSRLLDGSASLVPTPPGGEPVGGLGKSGRPVSAPQNHRS